MSYFFKTAQKCIIIIIINNNYNIFSRVNPSAEAVINACPGQLKE